MDCFAEVAKTWIEPVVSVAGALYFSVPNANTITKAPADFNQKVLEVHKHVMAAA